ncbi:hypothetical protein [Methanopyrus sp.]
MAGTGVSTSREDIALRLRRVSRVWGAALYVGSILLIVLISVLGLGALGQYSYQAQVLLFGNYRGQLMEINEKYQVLKTEFDQANQRLQALRDLYPISSADLHRVEKIRARASLELQSLKWKKEDAEFAVYVLKDPATSDLKLKECMAELRRAEVAVKAFVRAVRGLENKYAGETH